MSLPEQDLEMRRLARQLRQPEGPDGIQVGHLMAQSNAGMITACINALPLKDGHSILEIGHGNGSHISDVLVRAARLIYHGVEISDTMTEEAQRLNEALIKSGEVQFYLSDGRSLPFPDGSINVAFTVNTIYFWEDIPTYLGEIRRVLTSEGSLSIGFTTRSFMEQLPFTQFGFTQFEEDDVRGLLVETGFQITGTQRSVEEVVTKDGQSALRPVVVITATPE